MNLTNTDTVRKLMSDYETSDAEPTINMLIVSVSAAAERFMGRSIESVSRTEYFDVERHQDSAQLAAWPVSSITTVHNDPERDYGTGSLVDSDDYVATDWGRLTFDYKLSEGRRALKVVYTGGLASTTETIVSSYPDLAVAIARQVVHEFRRVKSSDGSTAQFVGGSMSYVGQVDWLDHVKSTLDLYRRFDAC